MTPSDIAALRASLTMLERIASGHMFFVGGLVRDLILRRKTNDIDMAYQGDLDELEEVLKQHYAVTVSKFSTLKFKIASFNIDIARIRKDTYPNEDGFAIIGEASIEEDILRRDFTINTAYMLLNETNIQAITRFLSGHRPSDFEIAYGHHFFLRDLNNRVLAVLHDKSFEEDPTRLLRVIKYSISHGFKMDRHTKKYFQKSMDTGAVMRLPLTRFIQTFDRLLSIDKWPMAFEQTMTYPIFEPYFKFKPKPIDMTLFDKWAKEVAESQLLKFKYWIIWGSHANQLSEIFGNASDEFARLIQTLFTLESIEDQDRVIEIWYDISQQLRTAKILTKCAFGYIVDENFANSSGIYAKLYDGEFNLIPGEISKLLGNLRPERREYIKRQTSLETLKAYQRGESILSKEVILTLLNHLETF